MQIDENLHSRIDAAIQGRLSCICMSHGTSSERWGSPLIHGEDHHLFRFDETPACTTGKHWVNKPFTLIYHCVSLPLTLWAGCYRTLCAEISGDICIYTYIFSPFSPILTTDFGSFSYSAKSYTHNDNQGPALKIRSHCNVLQNNRNVTSHSLPYPVSWNTRQNRGHLINHKIF